MSLPREKRAEILYNILKELSTDNKGFINEISKRFQVSRQTVHHYIKELVKWGDIEKIGNKYQLKLSSFKITHKIKDRFEESFVWSNEILPKITFLNENVRAICQYGFNEMLNNVIDHSESENVEIIVSFNRFVLIFSIIDNGIGIFNKIQKTLNLSSPRESIIELEKGKFTSDPKNHSGEGIFFTSRAFDTFIILSENLEFHSSNSEDLLVLKPINEGKKGTSVLMAIFLESKKTLDSIFKEFTDSENDYSFSKTEVRVDLLRFPNEDLVSRSQAKRLVFGLDKYKKITLSFKNIPLIGQGFADEIFRVFQNEHPDIEIIPTDTNEEVMRMIMHVLRPNNPR
ncbi:MAG: hypothetical protein A2Y33_13645 [Spirochaetes bacterium GWF1_51_8]|nr:MAG: hypothetical protein A2Y33_13645 [Spirochaetes bacterium GWF1_51_8]